MPLETKNLPVEVTGEPERPFVFMGGVGYDEQRNKDVGSAIVGLTGHGEIITIPDIVPGDMKDGDVVVHRHDDGLEYDLPGNLSLKLLDQDAVTRFTRLHEARARELIKAIEDSGSGPVDAVFQSVDVSTGILAMHERPDLFRKVVLLDPSSIVNLPRRLQYLKEEWQNGNLLKMFKRRKNSSDEARFESKVSALESFRRMRRSNHNGNRVASYISSQAPLLHEVAQSEHAPVISIMMSRFDHAYTPERLLKALVSLDDISGFFVTNSRHGLGGKQAKLEQLAKVLSDVEDETMAFIEKVHFFSGVPEEYRKKLLKIVSSRTKN